MRHPEFPAISFLAVPLLLCSLPSHFRARSVCTMALIGWLTILNIVRGVNSLVWANNVVIHLEVWCDITTKLLIGFTFAVPLSALCICRHLEHISSNRQASTTISDRCRRMKLEGFLCLGVPMIFMALHYVVQGHRFDLFEDVGCYPNTYSSTPGVLVIWVPPLCISLVTLIYATAAFCHFLRRRIEFATILQKSYSSMSPGRYFRLMAFAVVEVIWDSGINIYILWFNINFSGLRPWISWNNVHSNFSRVATFPNAFTPQFLLTQLIWQWWIVPISSIFVFFFFSFGSEAMSDYRLVFAWLRKIPLRPRAKTSTYSLSSSLPTYTPRLTQSSDTRPTLPSIVNDRSGLDLKCWDELSPKMGGYDNLHSRSNCNISLAPTRYVPPSIGGCISTSQRPCTMNSSSTSLHLSHFSDSVGISPSRHSSDVSDVSSNLSVHRPRLSPTTPTSDHCSPPCVSSFPPAIEASVEHLSPAQSLMLEPSHDPSIPSISNRYSISDLDLTVFPIFMADSEMTLPHHGGTPCAPMALNSFPSSVPYTHLLGGVRITVEKNVV